MKRFFTGCLLWCLVVAAQAADAQPAIWTVQGKHNTVYLVGTMHYLPPQDAMPEGIAGAYADAEKLLMEIDMDDLDPFEAQQTMMTLGMLPANRTLAQSLGAAAYAKLEKQATELGFEPTLLNRLQPWLAAITLEQLQLAKLGMDASSGTEQQLMLLAGSDDKEIQGLETLTEQLQVFANFSDSQQRDFLLYTLSDMEQAETELQNILQAWRKGDLAALSRLLQEGLSAHPDLYRALTTERNRRWIPKLEDILQQSRDDYLVAVGALHLVGKDSVVDLLERAGYKVRRQ